MSNPRPTVLELLLEVTGNVAAEPMLQAKNGAQFGGTGIEAGGRIVLGTATTAKVLITDSNGVVLHSAGSAVTDDTDIAPIPAGIKGPLLVTVTEISDSGHTLSVHYYVKR